MNFHKYWVFIYYPRVLSQSKLRLSTPFFCFSIFNWSFRWNAEKRSFCLSLSFSLPLSVCLSICLSLSLHTAPLWKRINFYQSSISMKVQNINNSFTSIIHEHIYVQFKKNYKRWTHQQAFHILYTLTITIYSTNVIFLLGLTVHWKP